MNAEQIRAEAIEVVARASWEARERECGALPWDQAPEHRRSGSRARAAGVVDALAAAGLLPTGPIAGWAVAEHPGSAGLPPNIEDVFAPGERAAADEWRVQADEVFDGRLSHRVYEVREVAE